MKDAQLVIERIRQAFAGVALGNGLSIHEAQLADQSISRAISPLEYARARRLDTQNCWQQVPAETLEACDAALSHLCPLGWRFYLPAYMVRAIELAHTREELPASVIFHLTAHHADSDPCRNLERFRKLNTQQHEAVRAFLAFMAADDPCFLGRDKAAKRALERFWDRG